MDDHDKLIEEARGIIEGGKMCPGCEDDDKEHMKSCPHYHDDDEEMGGEEGDEA